MSFKILFTVKGAKLNYWGRAVRVWPFSNSCEKFEF